MPKVTDMTVGSPTKHILRFALPLIITNFGQQLYMVADAAIVGRGVGVDALASVGATDWIYWLVLWAAIGLTQGFSTFVSRFFGDKNYERMNKTVAMSVILCIAIAIPLTIGSLLASKPLLLLLKTPPEILNGAVIYLIAMIAGTPIVMAYNMAASILRGLGDGKTPLWAMIIAAVLNIGLDLLFVFVFHWGILGAAVASVVSQLVAFIFCFMKIRGIECIKLDRSSWKLDWGLIGALIAFGLPISLEYIIISLGGIILQSAVHLQGKAFIAGYTATNKLYGLLESSSISLGLASSTFLAQNYGAGNFERVRKGVRTSCVINIAMAMAVMSITMLIRRFLLSLFLDVSQEGAAEAMDIGVYYLTIITVSLIILYLIHIYRNALQAMEISIWSLISGISECAVRVIMSKVVVSFIGSDALFFAEPAAWLSALVIVFLSYLYYKRKLLYKEKEL